MKSNYLIINNEKGISLPEMLIVTIILGLLGILAYTQFGNGSDSVKAKTTFDAAQKIASTWSLLTQLTGTALSTTSSSMVASGNTALDVVMVGNNPNGIIVPAYQSTYTMSGLDPLSSISTIVSTPTLGQSGSYTINNYPVTLTSGKTSDGQSVLNVSFTGVQSTVVNAIYSDHNNKATYPFVATTPVLSGLVQYTAVAADDRMTLTLSFVQ